MILKMKKTETKMIKKLSAALTVILWLDMVFPSAGLSSGNVCRTKEDLVFFIHQETGLLHEKITIS